MTQPKAPHNTFRAWSILLGTLGGLYLFAVAIGPWLRHHIPLFDDIVEVIDANGIDSGAYFYSEIEGAAQGEQYLHQSLSLAWPEQAGLTFPFLSGVILCLLILWLGWHHLMAD